MFSLSLIMIVLVGHWFADFVCQTHWMATNKSKSLEALTLHVMTYSLLMTWVTGTFIVVSGNVAHGRLNEIVSWIILNGALHFITDFITSRISSKLYAKGDYHNFFVVIGFDQLIHYFCLFSTIPYFLFV